MISILLLGRPYEDHSPGDVVVECEGDGNVGADLSESGDSALVEAPHSFLGPDLLDTIHGSVVPGSLEALQLGLDVVDGVVG